MALFKASAVASLAATVAAWNCTDYSTANEGALAEQNLNCWDHIQWAIDTGLDTMPEWYPVGTAKTDTDVQCALFLKSGLGVTHDAHHCTLPPCAAISASMLEGGGNVTDCIRPVETVVVTTTEAPGPSLQWWGWVLIVAALCALGALIVFLLTPKKAPKKKRAVKIPAPEPEPAPVVTSVTAVPTYEVAPPVYTYPAAPVYQATQSIAVAAPQVITAPPVMAAPQLSQVIQAPPVMMAQQQVYAAPPTVTTAAPIYTTGTIAAAPVVSTLAEAPIVYPYATSPA